MLFLFAAASAAVPILGAYPCQRLNWAWRNVWNTCSILNTVPASSALGSNPSFFMTSAAALNYVLDTNGQYVPVAANGIGFGPTLCTNSPLTGTNMARNRCRRMMDVYGNLVFLCSAGPAKSPNVGPNMGTPDYVPLAAHAPHTTNAKNLGYQAAVCMSGNGINYPAPGNTCPGLSGWFNVVWNACSFTNAPSVVTIPGAPGGLPGLFNIPAIAPSTATLPAGTPTYQMNTPNYLCGASGAPTATTGPANYAGKGTWFRTTRCRKALDAFGRAGARCGPSALAAPVQQIQVPFDQLHYLAINMAGQTPWCNS